MQRENRYIVIKESDAQRYLGSLNYRLLHTIAGSVERGRATQFKPTLVCVVVESDWPEYEKVWAMIEARMDGKIKQPTPQSWEEMEAITNLPSVDSALRCFVDDATANNAVCLVSTVIEAHRTLGGSKPDGLEELFDFYEVTTVKALVAEMKKHVEQLVARVHEKPFLFQRAPREG